MSWIPALELDIYGIENPLCWKWIRLGKWIRLADGKDVAELLVISRLEIEGKIKDLNHLIKHFPSNTRFGAYLVCKLTEWNDDPLRDAKTSVRIVNDEVCHVDDEGVTDNAKEARAGALVSHHRKDGWKEVKLGQFVINRRGVRGEVEMKIYDKGPRPKTGLLVAGIEVRPI